MHMYSNTEDVKNFERFWTSNKSSNFALQSF